MSYIRFNSLYPKHTEPLPKRPNHKGQLFYNDLMVLPVNTIIVIHGPEHGPFKATFLGVIRRTLTDRALKKLSTPNWKIRYKSHTPKVESAFDDYMSRIGAVPLDDGRWVHHSWVTLTTREK